MAPLAAVLFNPLEIKFEGILSGFFGDSLRILQKMDHSKVLTMIFADLEGFSVAPLAAVPLNH